MTKAERRWLDGWRFPVFLTRREILLLHAEATLGDGRMWLIRLLRREVSPRAPELLEEYERRWGDRGKVRRRAARRAVRARRSAARRPCLRVIPGGAET